MYKLTTGSKEVFMRFSAYRKDLRLKRDGSWRPGTYATTVCDAQNIQTGLDAIDRYALPNSKPAKYVFAGFPNSGTTFLKGIVAPAFNKQGGGVEVKFTKGTQQRTVSGPNEIP